MAKRKGKSKNPAIGPGVHPKETKTANHHFESDPDRDNKNPISWVLGNIDWDGPFGWQAFKPGTHLEELLKQLKHFEKTSWDDLLRQTGVNHSKNHPIPIEKIHKKARKRLKHLGFEDQQTFYSFTVGGIPRMWGVKQGAKLVVLWWDPEHKIYLRSHK